MDKGALQSATHMATRIGHFFVATSDAENRPHMAVARRMVLQENERLLVQQWFCPGTAENLRSNSHVSVVIWDRNIDRGFQLIGETEDVAETGVTDSYFPEAVGGALPGVDNQLLIRITKIIDFKRAAHSDTEN